MELKLVRVALRKEYTIGHLYVDGKLICDTIEDTNRDVNFNGKFDNGEQKVQDKTCIPFGTYEVTLKVFSNVFGKRDYYKKFCKGYLPRLLNVPHFEGILIHRGVDQNSSSGCIIVGYNTAVGKVTNSQQAFEKLYKLLEVASNQGEKLTISIVKK